MLAFGSTVSAAAIRTALRGVPGRHRACCRSGCATPRPPDPARVAGSDGVVTVSDLDELPLALRRAGGVQ